MQSPAAERLQSIKMWSKVCDPEELGAVEEDMRDVRRAHNDKLANYRKRKDWQGWCEEDDFDLEGERLLAEIKNYKGEHMFNSRFY